MKIDPAITTALTDAVRELEVRSRAEVVIEIRARSGSYAHADARFASLFAFATLLVLLFAPWSFAAIWVAIDVAIAWIFGLFIARKSNALRRVMTTKRERIAAARTAAASAFHDRGVANTRAETGLLVYLGVLERHIELLADRGVLAAVPSMEWNRIVAVGDASVERLLEVVQQLTPLLERHLPAVEGDIDELCNLPRYEE